MKDLSLLYGPMRKWSAVLGAALVVALIAFVARTATESRIAAETQASCASQGETLASAQTSYQVDCGMEPADCDAIAGKWICSSSPIGDETAAQRSSSPDLRSPDLIFSAGGTAVWTAIAEREVSADSAGSPQQATSPQSISGQTGADTLDSNPIGSDEPDLEPAPGRPARDCTAEGPTLLQAERTYDATCEFPRAACALEDSAWVCFGGPDDEEPTEEPTAP